MGDEQAARALAPSGDDAAADRLAGIVANARAARVTDFSLRYVDTEGAYADGAWHATADAAWRFAGFGPAPATAEVLVSLQDDGDRVAVTGIGGGGRISPLWMSGPLQVRRSADTLVLVEGSAREARDVARRMPAEALRMAAECTLAAREREDGVWLAEMFNVLVQKEAIGTTCPSGGFNCEPQLIGPIAIPSLGVEGTL